MTSQIDYSVINEHFPEAGRDNPSQGFRDNFAATKTALSVAKTEITALQNSAILINNLTDVNLPVVNNLQGSSLTNGTYSQLSGIVYPSVGVEGTVDVNLDNGPVQIFPIINDATLRFINWPVENCGTVRVILNSNQGAKSVIFASVDSGTIHLDSNYPIAPSGANPTKFYVGGDTISYISVSQPGIGYSVETTATLSPVEGAQQISTNVFYKVVAATTTSTGSGFAVGDQLVLVRDPSVRVRVTTVNSGHITAVEVASGGRFDTPFPGTYRFEAATGSGTGASLAIAFGVSDIQIINPGLNYVHSSEGYPVVFSDDPAVTFSNKATAVAHTTNSASNVKVFDAWSSDGGTNIYIKYVGEFSVR